MNTEKSDQPVWGWSQEAISVYDEDYALKVWCKELESQNVGVDLWKEHQRLAHKETPKEKPFPTLVQLQHPDHNEGTDSIWRKETSQPKPPPRFYKRNLDIKEREYLKRYEKVIEDLLTLSWEDTNLVLLEWKLKLESEKLLQKRIAIICPYLVETVLDEPFRKMRVFDPDSWNLANVGASIVENKKKLPL